MDIREQSLTYHERLSAGFTMLSNDYEPDDEIPERSSLEEELSDSKNRR